MEFVWTSPQGVPFVAPAVAVDLRRTVPLTVVDELPDHDPAPPGHASRLVHAGDEPAGFIFACPGCGSQSHLPIGRVVDGRPTWTVTAGDPRTGVGLSLSPSIHHAAPRGCGWHGYLTNGVFAPC